jgi:GNAT superfamily N-acetyltransferase
MSQEIHLRPATAADAEAIARVHVETWHAAYAGVLPHDYLVSLTVADEARRWESLLSQDNLDSVVLVVERQDPVAPEILAFGSAGRAQDITLLYDGEVYALYVVPDWHGRGVGRRLLGALFRHLYAQGMDDAMLWVLAANPSRFFYEHMGGQQIAQRTEHVAGEDFPAIAYGWTDLEAWLKQVGM